jgi:hypothetical protein
MALNSPALARVRIGGRTVDLPRTSFEGEAAYEDRSGESVVLPVAGLVACQS